MYYTLITERKPRPNEKKRKSTNNVRLLRSGNGRFFFGKYFELVFVFLDESLNAGSAAGFV